MVMINGAIDIEQLHLAGITDQNGNYQTDAKIWFPTLYDLPQFIGMDEFGNPTNNFYLDDVVSDSIEIRIHIEDTVFVAEYKILNDINNINITILELLNRNSNGASNSDDFIIQNNIYLSSINYQNTYLIKVMSH